MAIMQTISEQVYQTLYSGIITGELAAGDKLTLKSIQDRLGVSSSPIREALTRLNEDGLIVYQPNVGMTVVVLSDKDVKDIFSLAEELDVIALKFAWESTFRVEMILELGHLQKKAREALENGNLDKWAVMSDEFHNILMKYSNNTRLHEAAEKNRKQLSILSSRYQSDENNAKEIQEEHDDILKALEAGNIKIAEKLMRDHLSGSAKRSLEAMNLQ